MEKCNITIVNQDNDLVILENTLIEIKQRSVGIPIEARGGKGAALIGTTGVDKYIEVTCYGCAEKLNGSTTGIHLVEFKNVDTGKRMRSECPEYRIIGENVILLLNNGKTLAVP